MRLALYSCCSFLRSGFLNPQGNLQQGLAAREWLCTDLVFKIHLIDWFGIRKSQASSRMRSRLTEQNLNWLMLIAMEGPEVLSSTQKDSIIRRFNRKVRKVTVKWHVLCIRTSTLSCVPTSHTTQDDLCATARLPTQQPTHPIQTPPAPNTASLHCNASNWWSQ